MGMSLGMLVLVLYYSIKIKGLGGWLHELASRRSAWSRSRESADLDRALLLGVANVGMNLVEYVARRCRTACVCTETCTPAS